MAEVAKILKCPKTGKRMLTRKESIAEAAWWRRSRLAVMNRFHCGSCGAWHIGNDRRKRAGR